MWSAPHKQENVHTNAHHHEVIKVILHYIASETVIKTTHGNMMKPNCPYPKYAVYIEHLAWCQCITTRRTGPNSDSTAMAAQDPVSLQYQRDVY